MIHFKLYCSRGQFQKNYLCKRSQGIVTARDIKEDEVFTEGDLTVKWLGTKISSVWYDQVIGKRVDKYYEQDELI